MDLVYMKTGLLTSKSDVFSFGIVLLELITRRKASSRDSTLFPKDFLDAYTNNEVIQVVDPEIAITENIELLYSITEIIAQCSNIRKVNSVWVFKKEELKPILKNSNLIGKGAFADIYKGSIGGNDQPVAVKKPNSIGFLWIKEKTTDEINIQSRVIHKNILKLIGVCIEDDIPIMVFEFASKGSLTDILHGSNMMPLNLDVRLQIAAQTARGLAYMHSQITTKILHGDVRPDNILLSDDFVPKISGFGLSRLIARDRQYTDQMIGEMRYMDPVYMETGLLTSKSDVFSFGIVLLELITRRKASVEDSNQFRKDFLDAYRNNEVIQVVDPEIATTENIELLYSIAEIILQCLNLDHDQRPAMTYVAVCLQDTV
ncbi:wall-associated receptor kinase 17-like [Miscanthus floridulus]|uniref:wall-associated receptor kinase 17-like n=1 Tax=Miscanthus floridulus TaxID=154761 RepID=UPI00345A1438